MRSSAWSTATFVGGRAAGDSGLRATDTYGNSILLTEAGNSTTTSADGAVNVTAGAVQFQVGAWPGADDEQDRLSVARPSGQAAGQVGAAPGCLGGYRYQVYAVQQCCYHVRVVGAWVGDEGQSGDGYAQLGGCQDAQVGHADDGGPGTACCCFGQQREQHRGGPAYHHRAAAPQAVQR